MQEHTDACIVAFVREVVLQSHEDDMHCRVIMVFTWYNLPVLLLFFVAHAPGESNKIMCVSLCGGSYSMVLIPRGLWSGFIF